LRSLLWKEFVQVLALVGVAFVVLCWLWFDYPGAWLVVPSSKPSELVIGSAGFTGLLLGYFQFAAEGWMGKREYLLHRGTQGSRVFLAKAISGLAGATLVSIGPLLLFVLIRRSDSENGELIQPARIVESACVAAFVVPAYGVGVLASQIRRHPSIEFIVLAFGIIGAVGVAAAGMSIGTETVSWAIVRFVLVQIGFGALLVAGARRLFLDHIDRDLPLRTGSHAAIGLLAIPLLVAPFLSIVSRIQARQLNSARRSDIAIVRDTRDDSVLAVARDRRNEYRIVDANGTVEEISPLLGPNGREGRYESLVSTLMPPRELRFWTGPMSDLWAPVETLLGITLPAARWEEVPSAHYCYVLPGGATGEIPCSTNPPKAYLDLDSGRLHVLGFAGYAWDSVGKRRVGRETPFQLEPTKSPNGNRFSSDTRILHGLPRPQDLASDATSWVVQWRGVPEDRMLAALVDPKDGTCWSIDLDAPKIELAAVELPDHDRFVRFEPLFERKFLDTGTTWLPGRDPLIRGEHGTYVWNGVAFVAFDGSPDFATRSEVDARSPFRAVPTDTDPLHSRTEVRRTSDDHEVLTAIWEPRNAGERVHARLAESMSLLRAPVMNVIAHFAPAPADPRPPSVPSVYLDPLLLGARRPALLAGSLALALVCAGSTALRMRRRGARAVDTGIWTTVVLLFGPIAFVVARMFDPRTVVHLAEQPQAATRSELLIQSA
jgi:hypothetical protein